MNPSDYWNMTVDLLQDQVTRDCVVDDGGLGFPKNERRLLLIAYHFN